MRALPILRMDWRVIIGRNVRHWRLKKGLTQEQLAGESSIDLTYEGAIERGVRNPSLMVLVRIANALSVHPTVLFNEDIDELPRS